MQTLSSSHCTPSTLYILSPSFLLYLPLFFFRLFPYVRFVTLILVQDSESLEYVRLLQIFDLRTDGQRS